MIRENTREAVRGMSNEDALEYMHQLFEFYMQDDGRRLASMPRQLTPQLARILLALDDATPRAASLDYLGGLVVKRDSVDERNLLQVVICKIRRHAREAGWPIVIKNHFSRGYRLERTDPEWVAPWDAA